MGRELFLLRGEVVVWHGVIEATERSGVRTAHDCFNEAWQRALSEGAVTADDSGRIQFRSSAPE
jgi:alkylated DNA nucleotide flippase Atl1